MNKPILYILVGLPFSGKSTLRDKIAELTTIRPFSFDKFWVELESTMNEKEKSKLSFEYVSELMRNAMTETLKEGYSVIYDSLNDTPDQREILIDLANKADADYLIIYLNTPIEVIKSRRDINESTAQRHSVDDENFNKSIAKFIPPLSSEKSIEFLPEDDITSWINKNLYNRDF